MKTRLFMENGIGISLCYIVRLSNGAGERSKVQACGTIVNSLWWVSNIYGWVEKMVDNVVDRALNRWKFQFSC